MVGCANGDERKWRGLVGEGEGEVVASCGQDADAGGRLWLVCSGSTVREARGETDTCESHGVAELGGEQQSP